MQEGCVLVGSVQTKCCRFEGNLVFVRGLHDPHGSPVCSDPTQVSVTPSGGVRVCVLVTGATSPTTHSSSTKRLAPAPKPPKVAVNNTLITPSPFKDRTGRHKLVVGEVKVAHARAEGGEPGRQL